MSAASCLAALCIMQSGNVRFRRTFDTISRFRVRFIASRHVVACAPAPFDVHVNISVSCLQITETNLNFDLCTNDRLDFVHGPFFLSFVIRFFLCCFKHHGYFTSFPSHRFDKIESTYLYLLFLICFFLYFSLLLCQKIAPHFLL